MKHKEIRPTVPDMPAAIKKKHRPTLTIKMPVDVQEEREKQSKGRYSIIRPES